jgi:hypothetical protein
MPMYQAVCVITTLVDKSGTRNIVWRGDNPAELNELYPRSQVPGEDQLVHADDGYTCLDYVFEAFIPPCLEGRDAEQAMDNPKNWAPIHDIRHSVVPAAS